MKTLISELRLLLYSHLVMALHTTEAYVLRTYTLAEADKICIFLTKEHGKVRGVAHGARKLKSRFGSALEPFTQVQLTYFHKEGRELVSVSTCEILQSNFGCASRDVETATAFSYLSELLIEFLPDNEPNEKLYRLTTASLAAITTGIKLVYVLRYFESWLLRLAGFFPDPAICSACGAMIERQASSYLTVDGSPRCMDCSSGRGTKVEASLRNVLRHLFQLPPAEFAARAPSQYHLNRISEINSQIIRSTIERDLHSREFLHQLSASSAAVEVKKTSPSR